MSTLRPLLASYGGGHAQIIAALGKAFIARGDRPTVIGFTTAYRELQRHGIEALSVISLLNSEDDTEWLELAEPFTRGLSHPDIALEETTAYFALGLRDLANTVGRDTALERVEAKGRKAFEPIAVMQRYLAKIKPDIVITTTSPRFELALLKAAQRENIPSIAVGDLFLVTEREWILKPEFADHLAVLSKEVADDLVLHGFPNDRVHVTGNPAFDKLIDISTSTDRRDYLRELLGCENKSVILFPASGGATSKMGYDFLNVEDVIARFEQFCAQNSNYTYIIRLHPNRPLEIRGEMHYGQLDKGELLSPEDAVMVSDVVCVENSTLGLQAALAGKPVICIRFADQVQYPNFNLAEATDTLEEAIELLGNGLGELAGELNTPTLGTAAENVLALVDDIIAPQ